MLRQSNKPKSHSAKTQKVTTRTPTKRHKPTLSLTGRKISHNIKANTETDETITINHRVYNKPQLNKTYVGMCFDGTSMEYLTAAMDAGKMPHLKTITSPPKFETLLEMANAKKKKAVESNGSPDQSNRGYFDAEGVIGIAAGAFPTYTNPNNVSIITGVSPLHHGICGNYYYDEKADQNVMMTAPQLIRSDSILSKLYHNDPDNTRITIITSKDKLKTLLLHQLPSNFEGSHIPFLHHKNAESDNTTPPSSPNKNIRAISVESLCVYPQLGEEYTKMITTPSKPPSIYDPLNSVYALQLGHALFQRDRQDNFHGTNIFYLSTTDYVQHKYPPGSAEANDFMYEMDKVIGQFHNDGAVVGITADHGMNEKTRFNGEPDITYLATELDTIDIKARVILPITDPYVAHHGALGGYATIHLDKVAHRDNFTETTHKAYNHLRTLKGCYSVIGREDAKRGLDLPDDRIGDIVVLGHKHSVFGTRPAEHDLTQLHGERLRSHGSLEEALVPLIYNRPLEGFFKKDFGKGNIRNFDLFYGMFTSLVDR